DKAARVGDLARDPIEVVTAMWSEIAPNISRRNVGAKLAFHSPCTLQHGMKIRGKVEPVLEALGLELTPVADAHLCCGSAGTYSILQSELSQRLRANKLSALEAGKPDVIATANIGCLTHLSAGTERPVRHWIELLDGRLRGD